MKIDVSKLKYTSKNVFEETLVFDEEKFPPHIPLLNVKKADIKLEVTRYEQFIYILAKVKADVVLQCSYTLKPFDEVLKGEEELHFSSYKDDEDEDIILYKGNFIEIDHYIYDIISSSVPLSPKMKGAKPPKDGKNYRVLSDEELFEEKKNKSSSPFDVLDDLDL